VDTWQVLLRQARPEEQVDPAQQVWPGPPQAVQALVSGEHWKPVPQRRPGQQVWPGPPQAVQVEPLQVEPAEQVVPQQGWPGAPQAWQ